MSFGYLLRETFGMARVALLANRMRSLHLNLVGVADLIPHQQRRCRQNVERLFDKKLGMGHAR